MLNRRVFIVIFHVFLALCSGVLQACKGHHISYQNNGGGMDGGGGGNEMKANFISRGQALSQNQDFSAEDRKALTEGLKNLTSVTTTPRLTLSNGQPIADQKLLVAWTNIRETPNGIRAEIQLKEKSKDGGDSWEDHYSRGEPLDDEIFHELMRASNRVNSATGKSVDENYEISRGKYHLDHARVDDLQQKGVNASRTTTEYGIRFCEKLSTSEQVKECRAFIASEARLLGAASMHDQTLEQFGDWTKRATAFEGMMAKSDRRFADILNRVESYKLQEFNAVTDYKGVGLEGIESALLEFVSQNPEKKNSYGAGYFAYVKKFNDYMGIQARYVRIKNLESR